MIKDKKNFEIVKNAIQNNNLEEFSEFILDNSIDVINFEIKKIKDESKYPLGISKFGEPPHLPKSIEWPYSKKDNEFKPFIGQINIEEVKKYDINNLLPKTGIIYLFYNELSKGIEYFNYPLITELKVAEKPLNYQSRYFNQNTLKELNRSFKIKFSLGVSVPNSFMIDSETNYYTNYENFIKELYKRKIFKLGQMFGCQDSRDRINAYEARKEIPLIEIPSFPQFSAGWDLEHKDNLIFWIKESSLKNKNFNKVYNDFTQLMYYKSELED